MKSGQAVAVLLLDGQLGALTWAFAQAAHGSKLGAIGVGADDSGVAANANGAGADASGAAQRAQLIAALRDRGLLAGELIAGSAAGKGQGHGLGGAIEHAFGDLGWDAAVCLVGPAFAGEDALGPDGGADALGLECAADAHALGHPRLAVAEMSVVPGGLGHQLSERTLTLLDRLAEPVSVALPAGIRSPVGRELREGLRSVFDSPARQSQLALGVDRPARIARHDWRRSPVDLLGFSAAGLPRAPGMPALLEDPLIHASALAAGSVLAELLHEEEWH